MSHAHRTRHPSLWIITVAALAAAPAGAQSREGPRPMQVATSTASPPGVCPTGDCVDHDLSSQDQCAMFHRGPTGDARWAQGLSLTVDGVAFVEGDRAGWDVTAYRIRWSNGAWSEWYVAGVNDIDHKFNPANRSLRRMWSYFADHEHEALACRPRDPQR